MKKAIFASSFNWRWLGEGYSSKFGPKADYFYIEIGLQLTFWITLQHGKHISQYYGFYNFACKYQYMYAYVCFYYIACNVFI